MEPQKTPPAKPPYKNGVDHKRPGRGTFEPRSWSFLWRAKLEMAVALGVIAGVIGVFIFLVQIPGALVVRLLDEKKNIVMHAHVTCHHPGANLTMSGFTDVFGEAKFPGLERGTWTCTVEPPSRFFSPPLVALGEVRPRLPAVIELRVTRTVDVEVQVERPKGAPRAAVAVRAVCPPTGGLQALGWEARAGLLDGAALVYLPPNRACKIGLLKGAKMISLPPEQMELDCTQYPCSDSIQGAPSDHLTVKLTPTRDQWELARPPMEPDEAPSVDAGVR